MCRGNSSVHPKVRLRFFVRKDWGRELGLSLFGFLWFLLLEASGCELVVGLPGTCFVCILCLNPINRWNIVFQLQDCICGVYLLYGGIYMVLGCFINSVVFLLLFLNVYFLN